MSICAGVGAPRGALGKRKERDSPDPPLLAAAPARAEPGKPAPPARLSKPSQGGNSKLLAGYLANEFLTCGTLLGERLETSRRDPAAERAEPGPGRRYAEVLCLLMAGGAHIAGVVNPTQLGRWLRIE